MELIRIGNKLIDPTQINRSIERIFKLRSQGLSQQEVAQRLGLDRTFISRLEKLGEVRKGKRIALVAFPVENKDDVISLAEQEGLDFVLVMDEKERWDFVENRTGVNLFNEVMDIILKLSSYDVVIFAGSDMRIPFVERIIDTQVIGICLGKSPIKESKELPVCKLNQVISQVRN